MSTHKLTDEEIVDIADSGECNPDQNGWGAKFDFMAFARAIESLVLSRLSGGEAVAWQARKAPKDGRVNNLAWGPSFTSKSMADELAAEGYEVRALGVIAAPPVPQADGLITPSVASRDE